MKHLIFILLLVLVACKSGLENVDPTEIGSSNTNNTDSTNPDPGSGGSDLVYGDKVLLIGEGEAVNLDIADSKYVAPAMGIYTAINRINDLPSGGSSYRECQIIIILGITDGENEYGYDYFYNQMKILINNLRARYTEPSFLIALMGADYPEIRMAQQDIVEDYSYLSIASFEYSYTPYLERNG